MLNSQKTDIQADSHFHPSDYPALKDSLAIINEKMANMPIIHKADMLMATLKGQAMNKAWVSENPAVAALLVSHTLPVQELIKLFTQSRKADHFTMELENYIRNWFKVTTPIY